jgi:hypothetical protein
VLRRGVLLGMQHEAACDVMVRMRKDGAEPQYMEGLVIGAPPSLPDGDYLVEFEQHTMRAKKQGGSWVYSHDIQQTVLPPFGSSKRP